MSTFDSTVSMLELLPESDLIAVQGIVQALTSRRSDELFFKPSTEEQLVARVEAAVEEVKEGKYKDAETFENEVITKFGL